jgi:hypothetical protein
MAIEKLLHGYNEDFRYGETDSQPVANDKSGISQMQGPNELSGYKLTYDERKPRM